MQNKFGFSAIEFLIVIGILSFLGFLAIPRFHAFQARARQAEARTILNHIYTLEESYHLENNMYKDFSLVGWDGGRASYSCSVNMEDNPGAAALGFALNPCGVAKLPRYGYFVNGATSNEFTAVALSGTGKNNFVVPGCQTADQVTINQERNIIQVSNAVSACLKNASN